MKYYPAEFKGQCSPTQSTYAQDVNILMVLKDKDWLFE